MAENNFEKQVQDKMKALSIMPSGEVWKGVSSRINKKKDQRWGILFFYFLLGSVILFGGWHLFNNSHSGTFGTNKAISTDTTETAIHLNKLIGDSNKSARLMKDNEVKASTKKESVISNIAKNESNFNYTLFKKEKINPDYVKKDHLKKVFNSSLKSKTQDPSVGEIVSNERPLKSISTDTTVNVNSSHEQIVEAPKSNIQDTLVNNKILNPDTNNLHTYKSVHNIVKPKWEFGFSLSGGLSEIGNSLFSFLSLDKSFATAMSVGTGTTGQYASTQPSEIRNSGAFSIGLIAKRKLSKGTNISTGLNFTYYSTIRKIPGDSSAGYSLRSTSHDYVSKFNLIEIPFNIQFRLSNNKTLPIYFEGGINFSQLIFSNAMQFNQQQNYTINNAVFNSSQIGLQFNFSADLIRKRNFTIAIGPKLRYDITSIASTGEYGGKHFAYAGVHTSILFHKRK